LGLETMKRAFAILGCLCVLAGAEYFAVSKWAIRHETLDLFDATRQRPVSVDVAVRRDYEMKADKGLWKLPIAIISNGNTVRNTEYSFLANALATRGYLVASIQQDLPSDPPLMTKVGLPYAGRRAVYLRCEANILFVLGEMQKRQPNADYDHLTLVGHSNGGDVSMYVAKQHPELVSKVITLDNLRVPFVLSDRMKILSFRSKDPKLQDRSRRPACPCERQVGRHRYRRHRRVAHRSERSWSSIGKSENSDDPGPVSEGQRRQRSGAGEHRTADDRQSRRLLKPLFDFLRQIKCNDSRQPKCKSLPVLADRDQQKG